jgi:hypothetical protein
MDEEKLWGHEKRNGGAMDEKRSGEAHEKRNGGAMDEKRSCGVMRREMVGPWIRREVVGS